MPESRRPSLDLAEFNQALTAQRTVEYVEERARRGSREKFEPALAELPDLEPEPYDKL